MDKKNIMVIVADLKIGGAQAVAANIAKYAPENYRFCYVLLTDEVGEYEKEILVRNHRIVRIPEPAVSRGSYFKNLLKLMRQEKFDVVHCHTMFNCGVVMMAAWAAGVPCRISHSHTIKEGCEETALRRCYQHAMRCLIRCFGNVGLACGYEAGHVLYGRKWFARKGIVIPNGIESRRYRYSEESRKMVREALGLDEEFVIGHVGHYAEVKNQTFLIDLMQKIRRERNDAVLLMFGEGDDRKMLQKKINEAGCGDYVRLMGNVTNVHQVLSAFDVFAFPSLFEGTPIALIEAQANGLPCVISEAIPDDACLTEDIRRVPLTNDDAWVRAILEVHRMDAESKFEHIRRNYGDVQDALDRVYAIYEAGKR